MFIRFNYLKNIQSSGFDHVFVTCYELRYETINSNNYIKVDNAYN